MFSVPDLGENNAAKQYVPGIPRLVKCYSALCYQQSPKPNPSKNRVKESELFGDIVCRVFWVKNKVIVLAKFNVHERGFFLLGVRLNGTSIF